MPFLIALYINRINMRYSHKLVEIRYMWLVYPPKVVYIYTIVTGNAKHSRTIFVVSFFNQKNMLQVVSNDHDIENDIRVGKGKGGAETGRNEADEVEEDEEEAGLALALAEEDDMDGGLHDALALSQKWDGRGTFRAERASATTGRAEDLLTR